MKNNIWIIEFVNQKAFNEFQDLPLKIKTRLSHIIKMLEIYGNEVGEPHTASLGEGFFKIKDKSREGVARSIYCYQKGRKILILATAIKKQDKLPNSVIQIAKQRLKEYQDAND